MKAVIVSTADEYANGVKPRHLKEYLEKKGFEVELLQGAHRTDLKGIFRNLMLSKYKIKYLLVVAGLGISRIIPTNRVRRIALSFNSVRQASVYGQITHSRLKLIGADLVICESNFDIGYVNHGRVATVQVLDLPCPLAEELYYGNQISKSAYEKYKQYEVEAYGNADALSFHWHTYAKFVKKTKYDGGNIIDMGYGTTQKEKTAQFAAAPRVIFLGYLKGYWVNTPLLEKLCEAYPGIDVYGGPKPPEGSNINYKGYAPTLDVMADYQFGLITISDDILRQNSFSSKHLEYISYGLPVFTPVWRQDEKLDAGSIYYSDTEDFIEKLHDASAESRWAVLNEAALATAHDVSWERALTPLGDLLTEKGIA